MRSLTTGASLDCSTLEPSAIEHLLQRGLGPVLAHVADQAGASGCLVSTDSVRAAELTARALTAEK